jgi:hypothetical protein
MFATVALLVIVLGLMVSLARHVRETSAVDLTKDLLIKLDRLVAQYAERHGGEIPPAPALSAEDAASLDEQALHRYARSNNAQFVRTLRGVTGLEREFSHLSVAMYDQVAVRDAWGTPIILMPVGHPAVGMAPKNASFFFSAGPDKQYLTREDNLYSYEESGSP